jgi:uncharacterized membrane protein YdjX (TVP38/TMEM64 family)
MGFIEYYIIFALTTSIFALIDVFIPILNEVRADEVSNVLTENPKLSCFVYFCITTIVAPFVVLPIVIPSMNVRFREAMAKVIREP